MKATCLRIIVLETNGGVGSRGWRWRCTGLTLRELGEAAGGMDYTAVSMAVKRLEERPGEGQSHASDGVTAVGGEVGEMWRYEPTGCFR